MQGRRLIFSTVVLGASIVGGQAFPAVIFDEAVPYAAPLTPVSAPPINVTPINTPPIYTPHIDGRTQDVAAAYGYGNNGGRRGCYDNGGYGNGGYYGAGGYGDNGNGRDGRGYGQGRRDGAYTDIATADTSGNFGASSTYRGVYNNGNEIYNFRTGDYGRTPLAQGPNVGFNPGGTANPGYNPAGIVPVRSVTSVRTVNFVARSGGGGRR